MQAAAASKSVTVLEDEHNYAQTSQERPKQKNNPHAGDGTSKLTADGIGGDKYSDIYALGDTQKEIHTTETAQPNTLNSASVNLPIEKSLTEPRMSVINYPEDIDAIYPLSVAEEVVENALELQILSPNPLSFIRTRTNGPRDVRKSVSTRGDMERQSIAGPSTNCGKVSLAGGKSDPVEVIYNCAKCGSNQVIVSYCKILSNSDDKRRQIPENDGNKRCTEFPAVSKKKTKLEGQTDEARPGPSQPELVSLISEDEHRPESSNSESERKTRRHHQTLLSENNTTQQLSDKENTIIEETKTSNQKTNDDNSELIPKNKPPEKDVPKIRHLRERNFALWEQREMLKYLINNNSISAAKGNKIWQQMIDDGFLRHRTFQSLHNHFRRAILPNIGRFHLDPEVEAKLLKLIDKQPNKM